jgi:hypothetical protein
VDTPSTKEEIMSIRTFRSSSGLTLAGLVMLLGAALPKQPVHGTVKGSQGDPKQFASVSLDGPGHYAAITDANGSFVIQEVSPGTYAVHVRQGDRRGDFLNVQVGDQSLDLTVSW